MRARFGLGLGAGVLLGLLIVGSTSFYPTGQTAQQYSQMAPYELAVRASSTLPSVSSASTATTIAAGAAAPPRAIANVSVAGVTSPQGTFDTLAGSAAYGNGSQEHAVLASQVGSMARQPLVISLAAFLPVVAAVLFGVVLYRVSKTRQDEAPPAP